jgi:hypothetical protein
MVRVRPQIPTIHISFVNGKGAKTSVMSLPTSKRRRKLDHTEWDRDESIGKFLWYLSRRDIEGLEAAADALIRLDCLGDALKDCLKGQRLNLRRLKTLLHLWNSRGLWSVPRALKEDLCLFTDAIRFFAPPYIGDGLTLYRGQSRTRHENGIYGIAWTSRYEIAEQFSGLRDTPGIVVKVDASQDMIVVHVPDCISTPKTDPANKLDYEDEYLLDPRKLVGRVTAAY